MTPLVMFLLGALVAGLLAFWLARGHRTHRDYRAAKAAVPIARAALLRTTWTFLGWAVIAVLMLVAIGYMVSRH